MCSVKHLLVNQFQMVFKMINQILGYAYGIFGGIGITAGAHRLWAHRAYKANFLMRLILATANLIAFQNCIYDWVNTSREKSIG